MESQKQNQKNSNLAVVSVCFLPRFFIVNGVLFSAFVGWRVVCAKLIEKAGKLQ